MTVIGREPKTPSHELRTKTVSELKELAMELGVKKPGVGWATCCPDTGSKQDIVTAIDEFMSQQSSSGNGTSNRDSAAIAHTRQDSANNSEPTVSEPQDSEGSGANDSLTDDDEDAELKISSYELHAQTVDELKVLAETLGVKQPGIGWATCCPQKGNKQDIVAAIEKFLSSHQLLTKTVSELKEIAEELGVKKPGVGWATCCPDTGNKQDIVTAVEKFILPKQSSSEVSIGDSAASPEFQQSFAEDAESAVSVPLDSEGSGTNDSPADDDELKIPSYELHAETVDELKLLAEMLGVKQPGVGWATCCPEKGNKQDIVGAIEKFLSSRKLLTKTVHELKELAEELGVKKPGVGWATCCPDTGNKQDIVTAIEKFFSS